MLKFLAKLDRLDRKTVYLFVFLAAAIPFIFPIRLPLYVWKETRSAFDITQDAPHNKVVAICSTWVGGSQGENWPQYQAIVAHCMLNHLKFIVFAIDSDPMAPQMAEAINETEAKKYGCVYGRDWVNLGLCRGAPLTMGAIGRNVKNVFQRDIHGHSTQDYTALPIMRKVQTVRDFSCLWVVDYQPSMDWLVFLDPTNRVPILFASAAIMSSGYYPYLSSGQLKGILVGSRGAAEYEQLIKENYGKRFDETGLRGQRLFIPLAFGQLIIILLVVAGNVGMIARRRLAGAQS